MKRKKLLFSLGFVGIISIYSIGQTFSGDSRNTTTGVESGESGAWFKMGEMRVINNDWGSKSLDCATPTKIFINEDGSFGWDFDRGPCGAATGNSAPDYPEVEFGLHPFGHIKDSATASDTSSTTLLPLQIKNINSASIKIDQMTIDLENPSSWNICFEMWFTTKDPTLIDTGECPYAEVMVFWGWQDGRWPCDQVGNVTSGGDNYVYCHHSDDWACGWKYMQFRLADGPKRTYNNTLDVKVILDWLVSNKGIPTDVWVTRFEIGTEIADNTKGKLTIKNLTFEVNGESRSPVFYDPTGIGEKPRESVSPKRHNGIFPAGTSVEIVNLQGVRKTVRTGTRSRSAAELSKSLPRGVYLMYTTDGKCVRSKNAVVVPVL
jgi:hypothetical protein